MITFVLLFLCKLLDCKYFSRYSLRSSSWRVVSGSSFLEGNSGIVS